MPVRWLSWNKWVSFPKYKKYFFDYKYWICKSNTSQRKIWGLQTLWNIWQKWGGTDSSLRDWYIKQFLKERKVWRPWFSEQLLRRGSCRKWSQLLRQEWLSPLTSLIWIQSSQFYVKLFKDTTHGELRVNIWKNIEKYTVRPCRHTKVEDDIWKQYPQGKYQHLPHTARTKAKLAKELMFVTGGTAHRAQIRHRFVYVNWRNLLLLHS